MTGFRAFLIKELQEISRTWRIWVIPGMVVFFAVSSPVIAMLAPKLISSMAQAQPGVSIVLSPATWQDAYSQFLKNLTQVGLIAVVITGAGAVSGERASGTAILTLTKPLTRAAFVLAKIVSQSALLVVSATLGTVLCALVTQALFGRVPALPLAHGVLLWLAYGLLLVTVMTCFSAAFGARGAAAGAGLAFFFLGLLAGIWAPTVRYTFVGLLSAAGKVVAGQDAATSWPLVTAGILAVISTALALQLFERQEL